MASKCPTCGQPIPSGTLERLRALRHQAQLTSRQMGQRLNPPRTHAAVSDIERGKTRLTVDLILQWARITNSDPMMLFEEAARDERADRAVEKAGEGGQP